MKIGIDARMYSSQFTGIGRYNFELIHNLLEIDSENEYYVFLRKNEFEKAEFTAKNITKVLADYKHYSIGEQLFFPFLLWKHKLDIVHFTHFNAPILFWGPKIVVTIHDLTLSFFPGKKMTSYIHRLGYYATVRSILMRSKKIVAVSNNTKKDIITQFKTKNDKVDVIYEGVNKEFQPLESSFNTESFLKKYNIDAPFLLYTGVWRDHKNVVGLIKAFQKVCSLTNKKLLLVLTGRDDPTYQEVKETIKVCNIEDSVRLVGLVPEKDLIALYNLAEVYVFPSFYEGFGLPPLEAMACKTPVVASNTSSIPEICGEGNAEFFDPYNQEDMAQKIVTVLESESIRKNLVERGEKRIKDFSWKKMAEEIYSIYTSLHS